MKWQVEFDPSKPVTISVDDLIDTFLEQFIGKLTPLQTQPAH